MNLNSTMGARIANHPPSFSVGEADQSLRIAVVYNRWPLPMRRADQMTVAHLLGFLHSRGHQVDLFSLETGGEPSTADLRWLDDHCRDIFSFRHGLVRSAWALACGTLRLKPIQVSMFQNKKLTKTLRSRVKSGQYDIVYAYYFRSAEASKGLGRHQPDGRGGSYAKSYLALQLSQTLNTRRIRDNAPNVFFRFLYEVESRLVAKYEARIWEEYTKTVVIGPADLRAVNAECAKQGRRPISNSVFGAHGTDVERFRPRTDVVTIPMRVVFSGMMKTPTNVQAAQWFARKVWPRVLSAVPDATFVIVGREPTAEVRDLASDSMNIEVTGTVDDPAAFIASAQVCVNPMQAGGGMQNKLIEFLASGKPVVATSVANEGIQAPGDSVLIADEPEAFARALICLLGDLNGSQEMANRGRAFVEEHWTWEAHFLELEAEFADPEEAGRSAS